MNREKPHESQWHTDDVVINVHASELDGRHVGISFFAGDLDSSVDLEISDAIKLRDELTRIIIDTFHCDESIRCPECGYTLEDAQFHLDHHHCRNYPFFPGESGKSYAK